MSNLKAWVYLKEQNIVQEMDYCNSRFYFLVSVSNTTRNLGYLFLKKYYILLKKHKKITKGFYDK